MQRNLLASVLIQLAVLTSVASASAQSPFTLRYSLFDPRTNVQVQADALQGYSVALDENTVVVGAPVREYGTIFGVANIYDAATGALLHTLLDPGPNCCDNFGTAVAVSGTRVMVSAPNPHNPADPGSVYVYDMAGAAPTVPVRCGWPSGVSRGRATRLA